MNITFVEDRLTEIELPQWKQLDVKRLNWIEWWSSKRCPPNPIFYLLTQSTDSVHPQPTLPNGHLWFGCFLPFFWQFLTKIFIPANVYTELFPSLWTFFWKHYNSFISLWNYLNFLYVTYWHPIYECYFIIFFKILTISGQERQICERTLKFFANFCAAPMNLEVFVWKNFQVLKNHEKAKKNWGSWKKCLFCFVYFVLKNSIIWSVFGIIWKIKV